MKTSYYEVRIDETLKTCPKEERSSHSNTITKRVKTLNDAKKFITDRYGKMPGGKNKIYVDGPDNNAIEMGFLHSFWNKDISHDSKPWYQTDWISIEKVIEERKIILL